MVELYDLALYGAGVVGGYFTFLTTSQIVENLFSQRINSEDELETIAREEAEKIVLKNAKLVLPIYVGRDDPQYKELRGSRCTLRGFNAEDDEFVSSDLIDGNKIIGINLLEIKSGWGANRGTVRHELYPLKKHFPRSKSRLVNLLKWFYQEPAATIYSTTGIKSVWVNVATKLRPRTKWATPSLKIYFLFCVIRSEPLYGERRGFWRPKFVARREATSITAALRS